MSLLPTDRVMLQALRASKIRGAQLAIVVDNNDGDGAPGYRVKVKFPGEDQRRGALDCAQGQHQGEHHRQESIAARPLPGRPSTSRRPAGITISGGNTTIHVSNAAATRCRGPSARDVLECHAL